MVYCSECGMEVSSDAAFCQGCGTELELQREEMGDDPNAELQTDEGTEAEFPGEDPADAPPAEVEEEGVDWSHAAAATAFAIIPAFGAYMGVSIAASDAVGWVFLLGIPAFAYLLYQRPTAKRMAGGMCFWLAVESFLTPVFLLIYAIGFASSETTTAAGQAGAAIGGFILVGVAFVVGVPVGIVFYLISTRLDVEADEPTDEPAGTQPA